jgi:hypothetical protein
VSALRARADALTLQRRPGSQDVQSSLDLSTDWREIVREQARRAPS